MSGNVPSLDFWRLFIKRLLMVIVFAGLLPFAALSSPAPMSPYVNDFAGLMPEDDEAALAKQLALMRRNTGVQFAIVIIDRMIDYGHEGEITPFARKLFDDWGIGDKVRNDGALMIVAAGDRQMRIELGAGYGTRLNVAVEQAVEGAVMPYFRRGDFAGGIRGGADAVSLAITKVRLSDHGAMPNGQRPQDLSRRAGPEPWWLALAMLFAGGVLLWRRRKRCPACKKLTLRRKKERTLELHIQKTVTCQACGYSTRTTFKHGQTYTERKGPGQSAYAAETSGGFGHGSSGGGGGSDFGGGTGGHGSSGGW